MNIREERAREIAREVPARLKWSKSDLVENGLVDAESEIPDHDYGDIALFANTGTIKPGVVKLTREAQAYSMSEADSEALGELAEYLAVREERAREIAREEGCDWHLAGEFHRGRFRRRASKT